MGSDGKCDLCGETTGGAGIYCARLDICATCVQARPLAPRVAHHGFELSMSERREERSSSDEPDYIHTRVAGVLATRLRADVDFTTEGLGHRLFKFVGRYLDEPQAGDPLFDDNIFVETNTPALTRVLLADAGVQSAVMQIVSELGPFGIDPTDSGCEVVVSTAFPDAGRVPSSHQYLVAALLHHIARIDEARAS